MGVVYKLQDEVREFILAQKRDFPKISCRKLSDVVNEKFHLVVSKSSISSVLKSANLNSPIGRHSLSAGEEKICVKKNAKKFKIPAGKKTQIFPVLKKDFVQAQNTNAKKIEVDASVDVVKVAPEIPGLGDKSLDEVSPKVLAGPEIFVSMAGLVFLKAVEWKVAGFSILGKILKEELGDLPGADFDNMADGLLFSKIFDENGLKNFDIAQWRWIPGAERYQSGEKFSVDFLEKIKNISDGATKISIEVEVLSGGVSSAKLCGQQGRSFFVDFSSRNVHSENVHSGNSISFTQAIQRVTSEISKNVQTAIFYCVDGKENYTEQILGTLIDFFGAQESKALKDVIFYNAEKKELMTYPCGQPKQKVFALALPQEQQDVLSAKNWESVWILDQEFYYAEIPSADFVKKFSQGQENSLKTVVLGFSARQKPLARLLTNANNPQSLKAVLWDFLLNSAFLGDQVSRLAVSQVNLKNYPILETSLFGQAQGFLEGVQGFFNAVEEYSKKCFFDGTSFNRKIYGLSASLSAQERVWKLSFHCPEDDARFSALRSAVKAFNSQIIFDPQGRRVILGIDKKKI